MDDRANSDNQECEMNVLFKPKIVAATPAIEATVVGVRVDDPGRRPTIEDVYCEQSLVVAWTFLSSSFKLYAVPVFPACSIWTLDEFVVLPMSKGVIMITHNDIAGDVFESLDQVMKYALLVAQVRWDEQRECRERVATEKVVRLIPAKGDRTR